MWAVARRRRRHCFPALGPHSSEGDVGTCADPRPAGSTASGNNLARRRTLLDEDQRLVEAMDETLSMAIVVKRSDRRGELIEPCLSNGGRPMSCPTRWRTERTCSGCNYLAMHLDAIPSTFFRAIQGGVRGMEQVIQISCRWGRAMPMLSVAETDSWLWVAISSINPQRRVSA